MTVERKRPAMAMPPASKSSKARKPAKKTDKAATAAKALGVSKEQYESLDVNKVSKALRVFEKDLAKSVRTDWHDGYEDQSEIMGSWFNSLEPLFQNVVDVGITEGKAFQQCHDVLCAISQSLSAMSSPNARVSLEDNLGEGDSEVTFKLGPSSGKPVSVRTPQFCSDPTMAACGFVWRYLLRAAAASDAINDDDVLRMANAASRAHDVSLLSGWENQDEDEEELEEGFSFPGMPPLEPLAALLARDKAPKQ